MAVVTVSPSKRSVGFLLGMSTLMLGANFVWTAYNNVLLPTLVERAVTDYRGLIVGLIGFAGTMIGITVSILAGIVSDHTASRWGRRTPSILVGSLLGLPAIALAAIFYPPSLGVIVAGFFGMQFFTNVSNGAWWPLLVDTVEENQRGLASGIQGLFTLIGAALGIAGVSWLNEVGQTALALWVLAIVYAVTGIINSLVIRGYDKPALGVQRIRLWELLGGMFRVHRRVVTFFWLVLASLLAYTGLNSMQFFARFFFETYFPAISPDIGFLVLGTINLVVTMLSAVGSGLLSDRVGRRTLIWVSMLVCGATSIIMGLTGSFALFLTLAAIRSAAMGPLVAVVPAMASGLAPEDEAGRYMAYSNLSTGLSGALASLLFGVVLTTLTRTSFVVLFVISGLLFSAGGLVVLLKVPQEERR